MVKVLKPPIKCQVCGKQFESGEDFVDGKTVYGPWAWMCLDCHGTEGCGFGTGRGQLYDGRTLEKKEG